jgi:hypothetical protein
MKTKITAVPKDWPVQPLKPDQAAKDKATCGHCGLSWDDAIPTSMTPAPSARCPFEQFHKYRRGRRMKLNQQPPTPKPRFELRRDGVLILTGTEDECWQYIHRMHCYSVSHATTHEGYSITPVAQRDGV